MTRPLSRRRALATGAILSGVVVVIVLGYFWIIPSESPPPVTKADCELAELPLPEGAEGPVEATAVSDSGEYIAGTADDQGIRWRNNEPEVLDSGVREVTGVNSSGVVVGLKDHEGPWVYRDGAMSKLRPAPTDDDEDALLNNPPVINDDEVIMAAMSIDVEGETAFDRSQVWKAGKDQAVSFPFSGAVWDINADGIAVGADGALAGPGSAHMWDADDGTVEALPVPTIDSVPANHAANGWAASNDGLLWDLESPSTQGQEVALDTVVDVDADGTVYGEWDAVPALEQQHGERERLPLPKEDSARTKILGASDDGSTIVGYSGIGVTTTARVWSCS